MTGSLKCSYCGDRFIPEDFKTRAGMIWCSENCYEMDVASNGEYFLHLIETLKNENESLTKELNMANRALMKLTYFLDDAVIQLKKHNQMRREVVNERY